MNNLVFPSEATLLRKGVTVTGIVLIIGLLGLLAWRIMVNYDKYYQEEPMILNGIWQATRPMGAVSGSIIKRSSNQKHGLEFTYSFWIFVSDWSGDKEKHVFHKGSPNGFPLQAPGVWLHPTENKLIVKMNTYAAVTEKCTVSNIPVNKWVHVVISVINKGLDVYINGRLKKRCMLRGIPKQNNGNVYTSRFGGFNGYLANIQYFAQALPFFRIEQLAAQKPSEEIVVNLQGSDPPYLSKNFWIHGQTQPRNGEIPTKRP